MNQCQFCVLPCILLSTKAERDRVWSILTTPTIVLHQELVWKAEGDLFQKVLGEHSSSIVLVCDYY